MATTLRLREFCNNLSGSNEVCVRTHGIANIGVDRKKLTFKFNELPDRTYFGVAGYAHLSMVERRWQETYSTS